MNLASLTWHILPTLCTPCRSRPGNGVVVIPSHDRCIGSARRVWIERTRRDLGSSDTRRQDADASTSLKRLCIPSWMPIICGNGSGMFKLKGGLAGTGPTGPTEGMRSCRRLCPSSRVLRTTILSRAKDEAEDREGSLKSLKASSHDCWSHSSDTKNRSGLTVGHILPRRRLHTRFTDFKFIP